MSEIRLPRIYLVNRNAAQEEFVQHALDINPPSQALVVTPGDAQVVTALGEVHVLSGAPIAIVAEFDHPLSAINEDGSVTIVCPAPEQSSKS